MNIPTWSAFLYKEVWEITKWKDGAIFSTVSTGKFIRAEDEHELDPQKFTTSNISTKLLGKTHLKIEIIGE